MTINPFTAEIPTPADATMRSCCQCGAILGGIQEPNSLTICAKCWNPPKPTARGTITLTGEEYDAVKQRARVKALEEAADMVQVHHACPSWCDICNSAAVDCGCDITVSVREKKATANAIRALIERERKP